MLAIITTSLLCYLAAGIYIVLLFDYVDDKRGLQFGGYVTQLRAILTWPMFLHFIAHEHEYFVEIDDD